MFLERILIENMKGMSFKCYSSFNFQGINQSDVAGAPRKLVFFLK